MKPLALPIDGRLPDVVRRALGGVPVVLSAPPGSGKTTRVPPALVDGGLSGEVVVLEPRRVAARAAARRVAAERAGRLGEEIGFQVRHDRCVSRRTRVRYVTEGILVRRLISDPFLDGVGAVVLDEFHERHVEGDLALAMVEEVRGTVRPDLVVVVMSATLEVEPIVAYLRGSEHIDVAGAQHEVEIVHAPRVDDGPLPDRVRAAARKALEETGGDVLVFLPGIGEIRRVAASLSDLAERNGLWMCELHGSLPADQQDRVLGASPRRKIVLATNLAESSLTIDGVTAVVDSGLARILRHDHGRGLDVLRIERISRASADQRAGRAGRTGPGRCYRLWTAGEERAMSAFQTPEIRRVDLAGPVLLVRAFGRRPPSEFAWFELPDPAALERADDLLAMLGALDARTGRVTEIGERMLRLPLHPRLARILAEAGRLGCRRSAATVAALLSERDMIRGRSGAAAPPSVDLRDRLRRLQSAERQGFDREVCRAAGVDRASARAVCRARDQIAAGAVDGDGNADRVFQAVLAGFPDRVVARRQPGSADGIMVGGRGVTLVGGGLDDSDLFVAVELSEPTDRRHTRSLCRLAAPIERRWLERVFPGGLSTTVEAEFDDKRGQVVAVRRTLYRDLCLDETRGGTAADPAAAEALLAARVARDPFACLGEQRELHRFLARVRWLRSVAAEIELPELGVEEVARAAASLCAGRRSLRELSGAPVLSVLEAALTPAQRRDLGRQAPHAIVLPSGRRAPIDYSGERPFVAARLQEFFGLGETPSLAGGRTSLLLHLLAPNHRPVQITSDLGSFWQNVYPAVRSELRRRYPKHAWPDDPLAARAEARPRRRRP